MTTFTITINEQQMDLIEKALKLLQANEEANQTVSDDDIEEIGIMIDLADMTRKEQENTCNTIHGWCY